MAPFTRGKKRENLVYVPVTQFVYYGWKSKDFPSIAGVSATDITALGHVSVGLADVPNIILVIGAKQPNPPRVTKKLAGSGLGTQQSVSTFCAYNKLTEARTAGWSMSKARTLALLRSPTSPRNSLTALAPLSNGAIYAFPMNKADYASFGADLGLESAATITTDTELAKVVSGCSSPVPGKAAKLLTDGATFSSFYATSKLAELGSKGFDVLSAETISAV